jgi:plasmid maintenance system antidote protein VapI
MTTKKKSCKCIYNPTPVHPGATIRETVISRLIDITYVVLHKDTFENLIVAGVIDELSELMEGKGCITPALAIVLQDITGLCSEFWLNLQKNYDKGTKKRATRKKPTQKYIDKLRAKYVQKFSTCNTQELLKFVAMLEQEFDV